MPLLTISEAVLINRYYDPAEDVDVLREIKFSNVYAHIEISNAPSNGLSNTSASTVRIFPKRSVVTFWDYDEADVEESYLPPKEWEQSQSKEEFWTIRPGDELIVDGYKLTVLSFHDNRRGRILPHWCVNAR